MKLKNIDDTRKMGRYLGKKLKAYDCLALVGDLGSGKTTFTQALAKGMGIEEPVSSATFTLVNVYEGDLPMFHFDAYRLEDPEEFYEIGGEDYLDSYGVSVVEWANLVMEALPQDTLVLTWTRDQGDERYVEVEAWGKRSLELAEELKEFERTCL